MVAEWTNSTGTGDSETPGQTILGARRHGHVERVVESWLSGWIVVESGE